MKAKYIIGIMVIAVFIIWTSISFQKTLTPYVSIAQAKKVESIVQVKGKRLDSGTFNTEQNQFIFNLVDDAGEKIEVVYNGAKPGNFDQATDVVCVGQYRNGRFQAKELLVKCPSKYVEQENKT
jgi:cytochrome c-type biogenesis protein CcmE